MKLFILFLASSLATGAFAHEGHDQAPGTIKALHGGVVKTGKEFNLEMVASGTSVELFPQAHADETVDFKSIQVTATAKAPRGKPQKVPLSKGEKSFKATVDFQGAHRLDLDVQSEYEGKKDSFKFMLEQ